MVGFVSCIRTYLSSVKFGLWSKVILKISYSFNVNANQVVSSLAGQLYKGCTFKLAIMRAFSY